MKIVELIENTDGCVKLKSLVKAYLDKEKNEDILTVEIGERSFVYCGPPFSILKKLSRYFTDLRFRNKQKNLNFSNERIISLIEKKFRIIKVE